MWWNTEVWWDQAQICLYLATNSWHRNNALLCCVFIDELPYTCSVFMCFVFAHSWLMRDTSVVHLNTRCFINCLCHLELGILQRLKLLQGLGMTHRPKIVYEPYGSHDKLKKKQCCLLCIVLNFWLSNLHNPSGIFFCSNPYMHFHSWLPQWI